MDRLSYIKAWAADHGRVKVYVNGEHLTNVLEPSDAFELGIDHDDANIEWNRVDLWTRVDELGGEKMNKRDINKLTGER